ncbi:hypothetical protein TYRP_006860 [Tyrophagus putrescentiae]|nr:hypothetical protein TYRP_006860 [Tyrophagus putrescentiae]
MIFAVVLNVVVVVVCRRSRLATSNCRCNSTRPPLLAHFCHYCQWYLSGGGGKQQQNTVFLAVFLTCRSSTLIWLPTLRKTHLFSTTCPLPYRQIKAKVQINLTAHVNKDNDDDNSDDGLMSGNTISKFK